MTAQCFSPIKAKRVRITEVDECGAPLEEGLYVVSKCFVTLGLSFETEDGADFFSTNADGEICINQKDEDILRRLNVTVNWNRLDPQGFTIMTGFDEVLDGTDVVGFTVNEGKMNSRFALEFWTGVAGSRCTEDGSPLYGYGILPIVVGGAPGDWTFENGVLTFDSTGYTEAHSQWGTGPYEDSPLATPIGDLNHWRFLLTDVAPPAETCGGLPIPSTSS
jgi:hypothetical protein